jgi:hypothetical protein
MCGMMSYTLSDKKSVTDDIQVSAKKTLRTVRTLGADHRTSGAAPAAMLQTIQP